MKAVILLTMGSPQDLKDVRRFLFSLFSDPAVIGLPTALRYPLAFLLSLFRTPKARAIYRALGGVSPLMKETKKQAEALEKKLRETGDFRCFIGTSYASPSIADAVCEAAKQGATAYLFVPLYPQFSRTTTGSVFHMARQALKKKRIEKPAFYVDSFYDNEGWIQALAERIDESRKKTKDGPKIFLTAHGLPERIVRQGDPYVQQCEKTAEAILRKTGVKSEEAVLCYQSRVGPLRWIGPQTAQEIEKAGKEGRAVIVAPISFVTECSETAYEIDLLFRQKAQQAGCPSFSYTGTVGTDAAFIDGLARIVTKI